MADNEVKIHVAADADLKGIEETQKKIADLKRAADAYEAKGMDTAASSARADARVLERDVAKFTRERAADERAVTREIKEQEAMRRAGIRQGSQIGRLLTTGGVGMLLGDALSTVVDQIAASETLSNRRNATQAANARQIGILSGWRGSPGQLMGESWASEDQAEMLKRNRPQLETNQKTGTIKAALEGAALFGGIGAGIGSIVPGIGTAVGLAVGTVVGAVAKGVPAYLEGKNQIKQSDQDQKLAEENAATAREAAQKRYRDVEGNLELGTLRGRAARSMEGSRQAFINEEAKKAFQAYEAAKRQGATEDVAKEIGTLTYQNDLRERQVQAGAGLVDGRSGGAGIAAAAQWAMRVTATEGELAGKFDTLIHSVNQGNQNAQLVNQAKS